MSVVEVKKVYFVVNFYTASNLHHSPWVNLEIPSLLKWALQCHHTLYELLQVLQNIEIGVHLLMLFISEIVYALESFLTLQVYEFGFRYLCCHILQY
jgi:hypothetical protein